MMGVRELRRWMFCVIALFGTGGVYCSTKGIHEDEDDGLRVGETDKVCDLKENIVYDDMANSIIKSSSEGESKVTYNPPSVQPQHPSDHCSTPPQILSILNQIEIRVMNEINQIKNEMDSLTISNNYRGESNLTSSYGIDVPNSVLFLKYEEILGTFRSRHVDCWINKIKNIYKEELLIYKNRSKISQDDLKIHVLTINQSKNIVSNSSTSINNHMEKSENKMIRFFKIIYSRSKSEIRHLQRNCLLGNLDIENDKNSIDIFTLSVWIGIINTRIDDIIDDSIIIIFKIENLDEDLKSIHRRESNSIDWNNNFLDNTESCTTSSSGEIENDAISTEEFIRNEIIKNNGKLDKLINGFSYSTQEIWKDAILTRDLLKERIEISTNPSSDRKKVCQKTLKNPIIRGFHRYEKLPNKNPKYSVIRKLGEGSFGKVYLCEEIITRRKVAIKTIFPAKGDGVNYLNEARILQRLQYIKPESKEFLLELLDTFVTDHMFCMVFEFFDTDLYTLNRIMNIKDEFGINGIKKIMKSVFKGLELLKNENILHRDIKPNNILISVPDLNVKIADFGSCCTFDQTKDFSYSVQSASYRAPEVFNKLKYDFSIDLWSAGCIMYEIFTREKLFNAKNENGVAYLMEIFLHEDGNVLLKQTDGVYNMVGMEKMLEGFHGAYEIISGILKADPRERMSLTEVIEKLEMIK
eukprot:GHVP01053575.1.p1 GENE.GHVP01053575.1~~GHVP01053575.1.p1  ORF type:complete len:695 (+),score=124.81 GHVP01053575.1:2867-4951(+)